MGEKANVADPASTGDAPEAMMRNEPFWRRPGGPLGHEAAQAGDSPEVEEQHSFHPDAGKKPPMKPPAAMEDHSGRNTGLAEPSPHRAPPDTPDWDPKE